MTYQALYRKYRPKDFQGLVGQTAISKTLANAIAQSRLAHAYLFTGPRGTGKTSTARILAKSVNCELGPTATPCGTCANCVSITEGNSLDVYEIDAASNRGIDDIRDLRERVRLAPVSCRYKVYIIDEVHMLTQEAFNALLKTLEEPPPNLLFILATTEPHKVLATIHSRCQRFDFSRIPLGAMVEHLEYVAREEKIQINKKALERISKRSGGGLRDALSLLDQIAAIAMGEAIDEPMVESALGMVPIEGAIGLAASLAERDIAQAVTQVGALLASGFEHQAILRELIEVFRHLVLLKIAPKGADAFEIPQSERDKLLAITARFEQGEVIRCLEDLASSETMLRQGLSPTIALELILAKIASRTPPLDLGDLENRLVALEQRLEGVRGEKAPPRAAEPQVSQPSQSPQSPQPPKAPAFTPPPFPTSRPAAPQAPVSEPPRVDRRSTPEEQRLDSSQGDLERFTAVIKSLSPPIAAILQSGALALEEKTLVVALPKAWMDHFRDERRRQILERAIKDTFGIGYTFRVEDKDRYKLPEVKSAAKVEVKTEVITPSAPTPEPVDHTPVAGDVVQVTAEIFEGKIIEGKPQA